MSRWGMSMIFPPGFTGFFGKKDESVSVCQVDSGRFKAVCFAAARELSGLVQGFVFPDVTPNFLRAKLQWDHGSQRISLLCNRQFWIVGFCKPSESCALEYVDCPELAEVLRRLSDWQILTKAELDSVVDERAIASMNATDRQVIERARRRGSFRPARTDGDLLYHYWD
jgi:hypothetical protein